MGTPWCCAEYEMLPIVARISAEIGPRVSDVVAENVLFEVRLGVRRVDPARPIEAGEQRVVRVRASAIHTGVAASAGNAVGLKRCDSVDKLAEAVDYDCAHR